MELEKSISVEPVEQPIIYPGFPPGHFYSPVVDIADAKANADRIWQVMPLVRGVDFNDVNHQELLSRAFPAFIKDYDYPEMLEETPELNRFFTRNSQFSWLDARTLFVLLRLLKPKRLVEIGSGFSSLLTADVNHRFLADTMHFSCIEPYPRAFLTQPLPGLNELLVTKVEALDPVYFDQLASGDVLFIDSSHVSKTGSDVNYLLFDILPRLRRGVLVHIHDIFLPHDYPQSWVLDDYRSWNEQYLVRALLMYSSAFRIVFGCSYAHYRYPNLVEQALSLPAGKGYGGGSLWIERL